METKRGWSGDILGVFSTNILILITGFVTGIILPRELGPHAMGLYFAILAIPQLTQSLIELGVRPAIVFLTGTGSYSADRILSGLVAILAISTLICILIFTGIFYWLDNPSYHVSFIVLIIIITPLRLIMAYSRAFILAKEKIRHFNRSNLIFVFCNLAGVIFLVWILRLGVAGALWSLLLAAFAGALYSAVMVSRIVTIRFRFDARIIGTIFKQGIIFALSYFIIRLNYRIDIVLLERLSTIKEVGYYSLGVNVAELLFQLPAALFAVVVSRAANAGDQTAMTRDVAKLLRITFALALPASVILFFVVPYAIPFIYGEKFIPSIRMVQTILPGILFVIIFKVLNGHLSGIGKPYVSALVFLPPVIINIILNIVWIPLYGGLGAAMATNVSYTLGAITLMIVYSRIMKIPLPDLLHYRLSDFNFLKNIGKKIKGSLTG